MHRMPLRTAKQRLSLEILESRVLLSMVGEWVDPEDFSDFVREGYETPDAYYADPRYEPLTVDALYGPLPADVFACTAGLLTGSFEDSALAITSGEGESGEGGGTDTDYLLGSGGYVLVLDFDGARVASRSGDFWLGDSYVDIPAYDLTSFGWGGQESQSVAQVLEFVAEDYAAYGVTVTTTTPSSGEYTTIYVGGDNGWFREGSSVIGVATYDVGNRDASNYGFAFSEELGIYASYCGGQLVRFSEYLANLITHEAGHTFGANHVSDTTATMNPYLPVSPRELMFGAGTIPGTSSQQDTQSLLGSTLGYAHGADDHGDTAGGATAIAAGQVVHGMLERRDDVDVFRFTAGASGSAAASIVTSVYSNLDATLRVVRVSDGAVLVDADDIFGGGDPFGMFQVTAGQSYAVTVGSSGADSSGTYELELQFAQAGPTPVAVVTDSVGEAQDGVLDFSPVMVGGTATGQVAVRNSGQADLVVSEIVVTGDFALGSGAGFTVSPGATQVMTVRFEPGATGGRVGELRFATNDSNQPEVALVLTGDGVAPAPELEIPNEIDFGTLAIDETANAVLTIENSGQNDLVVDTLVATEPFVVSSGWSGAGLTIEPGGTR